MISIVEEIESGTLDSSVPLSDLLRKARSVASKLSLVQPMEWVEAELNGYVDEVPEYRVATGQTLLRNPVRGWQPLVIADEDVQRMVCKQPLREPVRAIEHLLAEEGTLSVGLSGNQCELLCRMADFPVVPIMVRIDKSALVRVLDTVRTKLLDWSLALQAQGIRGEGLSFSSREKEIAVARHPGVSVHIENLGTFSGNMGGTVHGDVNVTNTRTTGEQLAKVLALVDQVRQLSGGMGLAPSQLSALLARVDELEQAAQEPEPKPGRIKSLLASIGTAVQSVAGNVISSGVVALANDIASSL